MGLTIDQVAGIYRSHADVVFRRCFSMLGSRDEALDAVQEVFVKVLTGRFKFRGDSDPTTWIYRITTNHVLNRLRARRPTIDLEALPLKLHPRVAGPEGKVISRQLVQGILDGLDERGRAILFLHYVDGLDQGEVARVLGVSRRAVVKRLSVIRRRMEPILQGESKP